MPTSVFASCSDGCGWMGALVASFAFGTFGVPIKTGVKVEVDPLVMQSYKTMVCFLTCWLVVFMGEEIRFTPLGIVSGLFWVPGAACGIYGIRNAGLAVAVGTWSSIIVLTSFFWGIIVFHENVRTFSGACGAFSLLIGGLIGMSRYSKPPPTKVDQKNPQDNEDGSDSDDSEMEALVRMASKRKTLKPSTKVEQPTTFIIPLEVEPLVEDARGKDLAAKDRIVVCRGRVALTKRQLGILGAVINGVWGGCNLIPLHFAAKQGFGGAGYLISYATGSMLVNIVLWILFFLYYLYDKNGSIRDAMDCLPSFHVRELGYSGLLAGLLYSTGNFASLLAVTYLGQGVGYSFCQTSILVSGLWGIFYFKEITGRRTIIKWFLSAIVTITGIMWLSYEHQGGAAH